MTDVTDMMDAAAATRPQDAGQVLQLCAVPGSNQQNGVGRSREKTHSIGANGVVESSNLCQSLSRFKSKQIMHRHQVGNNTADDRERSEITP